jgi:hypothetical protein
MYIPAISTIQVNSKNGINSLQAVVFSLYKKKIAARRHNNSDTVLTVINIIGVY